MSILGVPVPGMYEDEITYSIFYDVVLNRNEDSRVPLRPRSQFNSSDIYAPI